MSDVQANDKSELVRQLKIDRSTPDKASRPRWYLLLAVAAVLGAGWLYWSETSTVDLLVTTAVAEPASQVSTSADSSVLDASGYITARRIATVSPKIAGRVVEVVAEEGMVVAEGQLLARLDTATAERNLALAQSQVTSAQSLQREIEVQLKDAELTLNRTRDLVARTMASQADLDAAVTAVDLFRARKESAASQIEVSRRRVDIERQNLLDHAITAPFAGVVIAKAAQVGEIISPVTGGGNANIGVCTIVDMESLEVEVDVNEAYINRVLPDQPVSATLNAYPGWEIPAAVIAIIPTADRSKATVRVRIRLLERDPRILPDMGVKVSFLVETKDESDLLDGNSTSKQTEAPGVLIPSKAIHRDDSGHSFAFVVVDGVARKRPLLVDNGRGERRRVTEGLSAGERVITNLDPGLVASLGEGFSITER